MNNFLTEISFCNSTFQAKCHFPEEIPFSGKLLMTQQIKTVMPTMAERYDAEKPIRTGSATQ